MKCKLQESSSFDFVNARCVQILAFSPMYAFQIDQGLPFDVTQRIWIILLCVVCHKDGIPIKVFLRNNGAVCLCKSPLCWCLGFSAPLVSGWGELHPLKRLEKMVNQGFALVWDPTCDG